MDKGVEGTLGPRALTELQSLGYFIVGFAAEKDAKVYKQF